VLKYIIPIETGFSLAGINAETFGA
jgi:hypothetical protein